MTWHNPGLIKEGESRNPNGRPVGRRNKRDAALWFKLEARGDKDPAEFLSELVSNDKEPKRASCISRKLASSLQIREARCQNAIPSEQALLLDEGHPGERINVGRLSGWILGCMCSTREFEEIDPTAKTPL
jgi:hypothetical protein